MPYCTFQLRITSDAGGEPALIFDYTARVSLTEAQIIARQKAGGDLVGVFTAIPGVGSLPVVNALVVATDQPINLKLASVSNGDGIIALNPGGILVVIDGQLAAGANENATINNVGTATANLTGFSGGT